MVDPPGVELPRQSLDRLLGFEVDPERAVLTFQHPRVLRNSTGAIQGGAIATSMEWLAAEVSSLRLGAPSRTTFLHLNFLAQGREPPFETRCRVLAAEGGEALCRMEVVEAPTGRTLASGLARAVVARS
jgi:acyl-coenzyme A thioesterase PaaI-like protein